MEFNCPTCQTKLRVSDERENPKVRCRACGTIFRPLESKGTGRPMPSQASPASPQVNPSPQKNPFQDEQNSAASPFGSVPNSDRGVSSASAAPRATSSAPAAPGPVISPRSASSGKKGGWGILFFIALMVLSRAPRLLRNFQRQPAPPPPVQIDDDILRQFEEGIDRDEFEQDEELPTLPEGVELEDLNQDLNRLETDGEAP
jgi:predicted Zn finger-like uncharacterized protein